MKPKIDPTPLTLAGLIAEAQSAAESGLRMDDDSYALISLALSLSAIAQIANEQFGEPVRQRLLREQEIARAEEDLYNQIAELRQDLANLLRTVTYHNNVTPHPR